MIYIFQEIVSNNNKDLNIFEIMIYVFQEIVSNNNKDLNIFEIVIYIFQEIVSMWTTLQQRFLNIVKTHLDIFLSMIDIKGWLYACKTTQIKK